MKGWGSHWGCVLVFLACELHDSWVPANSGLRLHKNQAFFFFLELSPAADVWPSAVIANKSVEELFIHRAVVCARIHVHVHTCGGEVRWGLYEFLSCAASLSGCLHVKSCSCVRVAGKWKPVPIFIFLLTSFPLLAPLNHCDTIP